jgi:hypothetical protein
LAKGETPDRRLGALGWHVNDCRELTQIIRFCADCAGRRMTFTVAVGSTGGVGGRRRGRCVESGPGAVRAISEAIFLVAQRSGDLSCAGAGQDGVGNGLHVSRVGAAATTEDGDLWVLCPQLHVIVG